MDTTAVNGVKLEYETTGSGEPVLLISPVLADGFTPLVREPVLRDGYRLIRYHKRGWAGSTHVPEQVEVSDHVADAVALLDDLGIPSAHVVGHSTGAAVAAQMALEAPERVSTVALLELSLLSVPAGGAFLAQAQPAFDAYTAGDPERALASFLSVASGMAWDRCRALLDDRVPGSAEQAVKDADTLFGVELPGLGPWAFGAEEASAIRQPLLSVYGSNTAPLWMEVAEFLRTAVPHAEEAVIDGVGHLLHIERPEPVARAIARFLAAHPLRH
ncbi:alpha/beta fold hydrolase [Geodermatophilus sp. SYSU D01036]